MVGSGVGAVLYALVTPKIEETKTALVADEKQEITLYNTNTIKMNITGTAKDAVIEEMVDVLVNANIVTNKKEFVTKIYERETQSSIGLGNGIAIPHAQSKYVNTPTVAIGISKAGFDYDALDNQKYHFIFMIAVSENDGELHLKTLTNLSRKLVHQEAIDQLMSAKDVNTILKLVSE